jgi:glycosyltransferase involved in cell wall biosynthesis
MVSVSVTTWNHAPYIAQALDGVLAQRGNFDVEIIVGDDRSTDGTREIVLDYAGRYPDLMRTVLPERNLGDGGRPMFVETIRQCRGRLVALLDGDDYWTDPTKLQRQIDFLDAHPDCSLCYHNALLVGDGVEERLYDPPGHPAFAGTAELLWWNFIASPAPMVRRDVVETFPAWYFASPWGDYPLYIMAAERGRLGYIDAVMAVYRIHATGVWSQLPREARIHEMVRFLDVLEPVLPDHYRRVLRRVRSRRHYALARLDAERGDIGATGRHVAAALRLNPLARRLGYGAIARLLLRAGARRVSGLRP